MKHRMRKTKMIAATLALSLAVIACDDADPDNGTDLTDPGGGVTTTIGGDLGTTSLPELTTTTAAG